MKDLYIDAHEELIEEALEADPNADVGKLYDELADAALNRMTENYADRIDHARDQVKEASLERSANWKNSMTETPIKIDEATLRQARTVLSDNFITAKHNEAGAALRDNTSWDLDVIILVLKQLKAED